MQFCAITIDNTSNNKKMMKVLAKKLKGVHMSFNEEMHTPCLAHITNLVVQEAIKHIHLPLLSPWL